MDMTKFEDPDDPGFVAVTGELRRWCRELSSSCPSGARTVTGSQQVQLVPQAQLDSLSGNAAKQTIDSVARTSATCT
jgi:hypothetical protein